jgi:uncharacterized protein (TIGR00255 family)
LLLSMTGFGEAQRQDLGLAVTVELRTINSRYFKFSLRSSEGYSLLEPQIEAVVRERIKRGTIQANVRVHRLHVEDVYSINIAVLEAYQRQLSEYLGAHKMEGLKSVDAFLALPGVVNEASVSFDQAEAAWPVIELTVREALEHLEKMRVDEGRNMANDLALNCKQIGEELAQITKRAPMTVNEYRTRLSERINKALEEFKVTLNTGDLLREVSIFSERVDISEEIVRLQSHLEQFDEIMKSKESAGRKLEFLIQEMFREVNTIGSKSTDVEIARRVIEMKTCIERLREMIQNVE